MVMHMKKPSLSSYTKSFINQFWKIKAKIPKEKWPNDVSGLEPLEGKDNSESELFVKC